MMAKLTRKQLTDDEKKRIIDLRIDNLYSYSKLAEITGLSVTQLEHLCITDEVGRPYFDKRKSELLASRPITHKEEIHLFRRRNTKRDKFSVEERNSIARDYIYITKNYSLTARKHGISCITVKSYVVAYLSNNGKTVQDMINSPSIDEVVSLANAVSLAKAGLTAGEIAKKLRVRNSAIIWTMLVSYEDKTGEKVYKHRRTRKTTESMLPVVEFAKKHGIMKAVKYFGICYHTIRKWVDKIEATRS